MLPTRNAYKIRRLETTEKRKFGRSILFPRKHEKKEEQLPTLEKIWTQS